MLSHVLKLLHDEPINHVGHVGRDFAGRESKLAVQQLVDIAQRIGEGVLQPPASGGAVRLVHELPCQTFIFLQGRGEHSQQPSNPSAQSQPENRSEMLISKHFRCPSYDPHSRLTSSRS